MNKKRGQAALEFLMTYGWAFLIIIVMVGALAYFGVLDPSRYVGKKCLFAMPFGPCTDSIIKADNLSISLQNNAASGLKVSKIAAAIQNGGSSCTTTGNGKLAGTGLSGSVPVAANWNQGTVGVFEMTVPVNCLAEGAVPKVQINLSYQETSGSFEKTIVGEFQGRCCNQ